MLTSPVTSLIEHIRRTATPEGDGELLGRFVESRDERAMAALIERHGPMVWGVCRRLLSHHDAEDAFQVTFIVLARKAASVNPRGMVGNWLYGVARQSALQVRAAARHREMQVTEMPDVEAPQDQWADVRPILDEELSRLPDHYRAVIVLSDLEGRTRRDVAAHLGCPEGTVASRLARARAMLAKRLTQRGVALSALALYPSFSGAMPSSVMSSTIKAAALHAAGHAALPLKVAALAEGVLKTMLLTKLKNVMAILVVAAIVGVLGFAAAQQKDRPAQEPVENRQDEAVKEKEAVAWGKEANGLQAGLFISNANDIRIGGKAQMVVRLRNVSKETIKVSVWPLWTCYPRVVDAKGKQVSTTRAPSPDFEISPTALTLNAGETVDVGKSDLIVAEPDQKVTVPDGVVDFCAIHIKPGMHKADCIGFLKDNHTLATGTVEFEVKAPKTVTKWGQEVDGLQIGLADVRTVRHGETMKLAVKLRNVGKADIKVFHGLLQEFPPQVAASGGGKVSVFMPPVRLGDVDVKNRVLKPGETITLYNPEVAVQPEALMRLEGIMRVGTPTICAEPGKYKIAYGGMIQSHPKLATGTVEFEVKDKVAWGKEVDGVQVGILLSEQNKVGETVTLTVRLRNNGKMDVPFSYFEEYFQKNPPLITDADGKAVKIKERNIFGIIKNSSVAPGKEVDLCILPLDLRPETDRKKGEPWTLYGTGKFHIQYKDIPVLGEPRLDAPATTRPTGKLELEVKDRAPEKR